MILILKENREYGLTTIAWKTRSR